MKKYNIIEIMLAIITFISLIISIYTIVFKKPLIPIILLILFSLLIVITFQITTNRPKKIFVLKSYQDTMEYLNSLAQKANNTIWTVRCHAGEAEIEEEYFNTLQLRLIEKGSTITDFRRVINLNNAKSTQKHLYWLIDNLSDCAAVKVKYYKGEGPQFDCMIVDHEVAVIGLPAANGLGVSSCIVLKNKEAILGVENAINGLFNNSIKLFFGSKDITAQEKQNLKMKIDAELKSLI